MLISYKTSERSNMSGRYLMVVGNITYMNEDSNEMNTILIGRKRWEGVDGGLGEGLQNAC